MQHHRHACCARVTSKCCGVLQRLGGGAGTIAQAVQVAVHDVTDGSAPRAWLNNPLSSSLVEDIYKATNITRCFAQIGTLAVEKSVPAAILRDARGFAILSVAKVSA